MISVPPSAFKINSLVRRGNYKITRAERYPRCDPIKSEWKIDERAKIQYLESFICTRKTRHKQVMKAGWYIYIYIYIYIYLIDFCIHRKTSMTRAAVKAWWARRMRTRVCSIPERERERERKSRICIFMPVSFRVPWFIACFTGNEESRSGAGTRASYRGVWIFRKA